MIGPEEAAGEHVALRLRDGRRLAPQPAGEVPRRIGALVARRDTRLWDR